MTFVKVILAGYLEDELLAALNKHEEDDVTAWTIEVSQHDGCDVGGTDVVLELPLYLIAQLWRKTKDLVTDEQMNELLEEAYAFSHNP